MISCTPAAAATMTVFLPRPLGAGGGLTAPAISAAARHVPFRLQDAPHPRRALDARGR